MHYDRYRQATPVNRDSEAALVYRQPAPGLHAAQRVTADAATVSRFARKDVNQAGEVVSSRVDILIDDEPAGPQNQAASRDAKSRLLPKDQRPRPDGDTRIFTAVSFR